MCEILNSMKQKKSIKIMTHVEPYGLKLDLIQFIFIAVLFAIQMIYSIKLVSFPTLFLDLTGVYSETKLST